MADIEAGSAPVASAPAPATAAPDPSASTTATSGSAPVDASASGEPPRERWAAILDNARSKTRAEVEATYRERYGAFERDPWQAVQGWLEQARSHSLYGPLVQQYFQEQNQPRQPQRGEEPPPDVPIVDAQGHITGHTYSDKALKAWHDWNQQGLQATLDERFGRVESSLAQRDQRDILQQVQAQAHAQAGSVLGGLRQQPYFKEHEPAIKAALIEHPEWGDNVHAAYNHVLVTQILPSLGQAEQKAVIDSLTKKTIGTTVAPNGTAPAAPKFKSFRQAAEYYSTHPDEAAAMAGR